MGRPRMWLAVALPLLCGLLALWLEHGLLRDSAVYRTIGGKLPETAKQAVDLDLDLAKWFFGLATSVIAGVAYYLRAKAGEQGTATAFSRVTTVGALGSAAASILCGHLWMGGLRDQLAADYLNRAALLWPERLQYGFFLMSLVWFGLLTLERELARKKDGP